MLKTFPKLLLFRSGLVLCILSCTPNSDMLPQDTFIEVYARLLIINEMRISFATKQNLTHQLLKKYDVSYNQFKNRIAYYHTKPEKWIDIVGETQIKIKELKELYKTKGSQKEETATDDRTQPDKPYGFIKPQSENSRYRKAGPDSSAERRGRND